MTEIDLTKEEFEFLLKALALAALRHVDKDRAYSLIKKLKSEAAKLG